MGGSNRHHDGRYQRHGVGQGLPTPGQPGGSRGLCRQRVERRSRTGLDEPRLMASSVDQVVVLFSSAHDADAFFTASAQRWPACSNRQYTYTLRQTRSGVDRGAGLQHQRHPERHRNSVWPELRLSILSAGADRGQQRRHRRHSVQRTAPVRLRGQHRASDRRQSTHNVVTFRQLMATPGAAVQPVQVVDVHRIPNIDGRHR